MSKRSAQTQQTYAGTEPALVPDPVSAGVPRRCALPAHYGPCDLPVYTFAMTTAGCCCGCEGTGCATEIAPMGCATDVGIDISPDTGTAVANAGVTLALPYGAG